MFQEIKENEIQQKRVLIILKLLKNIMVIFSTIFLNVYIFKALDSNFGLYLLSLIITVVLSEIASLVLFKFLSKRNAMIIYRLSFILDAFLIVLVLFIKTPSFPIILLFLFLQELANTFFYGPHEIGEMKATSASSSKKFLAKSTIITNLAKVISPFLSGLIIDKMSYAVLFIIIGINAIIMFFVSLFMRDFDIKDTKLHLKEFNRKAFKYSSVKNFYLSFAFFRLSLGGTIYTILPTVLFMKLGSEFSLGGWSSVFALFTILTMIIFMNIKKSKFIIILSNIMICLSCLLITFWTGIVSFIIFNAVYYTFEKLYENEIFSERLNAIKIPELEDYKKEHHLMYDVFANVGYLIGYLLIWILYKLIPSANTLSIIICIVGMLLIVSAYLLIKSKQDYSKIVNHMIVDDNNNEKITSKN